MGAAVMALLGLSLSVVGSSCGVRDCALVFHGAGLVCGGVAVGLVFS
jgi:hypothetical protein